MGKDAAVEIFAKRLLNIDGRGLVVALAEPFWLIRSYGVHAVLAHLCIFRSPLVTS